MAAAVVRSDSQSASSAPSSPSASIRAPGGWSRKIATHGQRQEHDQAPPQPSADQPR